MEECPKCGGDLRPKDHGLHPLHWALGKPICPTCYMATQPQRLERGKHREVFDVQQYPTLFKQRLFAEIRELVAERNGLRSDTNGVRAEIANVAANEVKTSFARMSLFRRMKAAIRGSF